MGEVAKWVTTTSSVALLTTGPRVPPAVSEKPSAAEQLMCARQPE